MTRISSKFTSLLKTGGESGLLAWDDFTEQNFNFFARQQTVVPKPASQILHVIDEYAHVLAAHVTSTKEGDARNAIFVSDIDMISDFFFQS